MNFDLYLEGQFKHWWNCAFCLLATKRHGWNPLFQYYLWVVPISHVGPQLQQGQGFAGNGFFRPDCSRAIARILPLQQIKVHFLHSLSFVYSLIHQWSYKVQFPWQQTVRSGRKYYAGLRIWSGCKEGKDKITLKINSHSKVNNEGGKKDRLDNLHLVGRFLAFFKTAGASKTDLCRIPVWVFAPFEVNHNSNGEKMWVSSTAEEFPTIRNISQHLLCWAGMQHAMLAPAFSERNPSPPITDCSTGRFQTFLFPENVSMFFP